MVLSFELRNSIASMYEYYYVNNEYEWTEKKKSSFQKKIYSLKYDKRMPSLNKKELENISWYWWNNFTDGDELDEDDIKKVKLLEPWLKKKGFDFM